ncbi:43738_t:CDS:1, partial [Gigaspora margarita]
LPIKEDILLEDELNNNDSFFVSDNDALYNSNSDENIMNNEEMDYEKIEMIYETMDGEKMEMLYEAMNDERIYDAIEID